MRLRKLYVDLVAADGTACIVYAARLDLAGLRLAPAGIERYDATGRRSVERGRADIGLDVEPDARSLSTLRLDLPGGTYALEVAPEQAAFAPALAPPPGLAWRVKLARARVRLCRIGGGDAVEGTGYADWVELGRAPRTLGLGSLEWGRLHLAAGTFIYSDVACANGSRWRPALWWPVAGAPRSIERWSLEAGDGAGARRITARDLGATFDMQVVHELHGGDAVDAARFPARLERALSGALAGPIRERRWLSRANSNAFGEGWAVHESVRFGRAAIGGVA